MSDYFNLNFIPKRAVKYFNANRNVLVVEDDKVLSQLLFEILDDIGFEVTAATSGEAALQQLQQNSVDFILLDLLLPEMDGFTIYSKLQEDPDTRHIPVMAVTAWADERNREKGTRMGIRHFLSKPFTEDELVFSILTLLVDSSRRN